MHAKRSNKKHKTFDDGFLIIHEKKYILLDTKGKELLKKTVNKTCTDLKDGNGLEVGNRVLEVILFNIFIFSRLVKE